MGKTKPFKGLVAIDAERNIGWVGSLVVNPSFSPTGKWGFCRRLDDGSPVSREVHAGF